MLPRNCEIEQHSSFPTSKFEASEHARRGVPSSSSRAGARPGRLPPPLRGRTALRSPVGWIEGRTGSRGRGRSRSRGQTTSRGAAACTRTASAYVVDANSTTRSARRRAGVRGVLVGEGAAAVPPSVRLSAPCWLHRSRRLQASVYRSLDLGVRRRRQQRTATNEFRVTFTDVSASLLSVSLSARQRPFH